MDITLEAKMDAAPSAVLAEVTNLTGYPAWHGMVHKVEVDGDGWLVDLGGRIGPFSQTKTVRLVRDDDGTPGCARFVRAESDGGSHSSWELEAIVEPASGDGPCILGFRLFYGGSQPLISMIEPMLRAEVVRSADRLRQLLAPD